VQAVDRMIGRLERRLRALGVARNTYIVFSSDNGFHLGQHRLPPGKQTAFEEDIHVPLIVRGPDVPEGKKVDDFAMNIDLAPTFADLAGAKTPSFVNGESLVSEMHGKKPDHERKDVLVEHYAEGGKKQKRQGTARQAAVHTAKDPDNDTNPPDAGTPTSGPQAPVVQRGQFGAVAIPEYAALRTDRYTYVEYVTGERQLYDLRADPDELHNIVTTADPKLVQDLAQRLAALKSCKGDGCRVADRG
jgi:arylsulfatase A-like enzyme